MKTFGDYELVRDASWQAFERLLLRYVRATGFESIGVVGKSGDEGADIIATKNGTRWLFQAKAHNQKVGAEVIRDVINACRSYGAKIPVVVSRSGFTADAIALQSQLARSGEMLQLWDPAVVQRRLEAAPLKGQPIKDFNRFDPRKYQSTGIQGVRANYFENNHGSALVTLATGLGKTFVAAEAITSLRKENQKVIVLAHAIDLVYQLERAFWPFMRLEETSTVFVSSDRPRSSLSEGMYDYVFATKDSMLSLGAPPFEPSFVVVDECHHLGSPTYDQLLERLGFNGQSGPFLLGLSATPWRPNGSALDRYFDEPVVNVDLTRGMKEGYLSNVDYRMFTDNIDWPKIKELTGLKFTPKEINRKIFVNEWDNAVVESIKAAWAELGTAPRGIVFCGTIDHAVQMSHRINALGFTRAEAIYGQSNQTNVPTVTPSKRSKLLWDFSDGKIGILCAVDVLNEGVDVPDVNLVVFQRVTHSRRIFTQQLGRGLRIAPGKQKVIVLDFVTDIRRFAAGLELERELLSGGPKRLNINSKVTFYRDTKIDQTGHEFLSRWLRDAKEIEDAGDDVSVLGFPDVSVLP